MNEELMINKGENSIQGTETNGDNNISDTQKQGIFGEEKMFTQTQLKELISERLKRERKVNEALIPVKELLNTLVKDGAIKQGSYGNMAKEITLLLKNARGENVCLEENGEKSESLADSCKTTSENSGKSETLLFADGESDNSSRNECGNAVQDENKSLSQKEPDFFASLKEISEKYPEDKTENLFTLGLFEKFARGKSGSICDIYGEYRNFIKTLEGLNGRTINPDRMENREDIRDEGEYSSTSFSKYSGLSEDCSLTKQQMEIAKSAGISYREYEELLRSVPKNTRRVNY